MKGKVTLEEHFALPETFTSTTRFSKMGMGEDLRHRLMDLQGDRLREMDEFDIEFAIQSLNSPAVQAVPNVTEAIALAQRANDVLANEVVKRPDRLAGFAALPMQDPEAAAEEMKRCIKDLGFVGVNVNGFSQRENQNSLVYYDVPEFRPFWAVVEELEIPFYLHPRNPLTDQMPFFDGHPWFTNSPWAFALETAMHALRLMGSGLFDEYPKLQLVMGHLGERIPFDLWRLDHRLKKSPQGIPAKKTMREYMRNNVHLTTSGQFYDPPLHLTMHEVGVERIMFSVDYPFETTEDACVWFDDAVLTEPERLAIGRDNAIKLFNLDLK